MQKVFSKSRLGSSVNLISLLIFCVTLSFISCSSEKESKSQSTIIEGSIQNPNGKKIYFCSYADTVEMYLGNKTPLDSTEIDPQGHFSFTIHNTAPVVFNLESGGKILTTNLILLPESHLEIKFTGVEHHPNIVSSGEASKFNNFLIVLLDSFYESPSLKQEYYIGTNYMDVHYFADYLEKRRQSELNLYKTFFNGSTKSKEYDEYAKNTIDYCFGADRLYYLWKKRMKIENIKGDSAYFSFQTKSFIQNLDAINCPSYIRYLNLYIKDVYERMVENGELPKIKGDKLIPDVEKYKLAHELLDSTFRDIVLYNIYMGDTKDLSKDSQQDSLKGKSLDSLTASFCRKYNL